MNLWLQIFRTELEKTATYRSDFVMRILGKALSVSLISWYLWKAIFDSQGVDTVAGLSLGAMGVYYLALPLTLMLVMNQDFDSISTEIYDGTISKYLVYPRSFLAMSFVRKLSSSWISLIPYLLIWAFFKIFSSDSDLAKIPNSVLLFFLGWSLLSFPCYFLMATFLDLLAFWFEQTWSLRSILRFTALFLGGGYVPLSLFPDSWLSILHSLPFHSLIGFQTLALAQGVIPSVDEIFLHLSRLMSWTLLIGLAVIGLWTKGLKSYNGSGM